MTKTITYIHCKECGKEWKKSDEAKQSCGYDWVILPAFCPTEEMKKPEGYEAQSGDKRLRGIHAKQSDGNKKLLDLYATHANKKEEIIGEIVLNDDGATFNNKCNIEGIEKLDKKTFGSLADLGKAFEEFINNQPETKQ